jgi:DNA polymerase
MSVYQIDIADYEEWRAIARECLKRSILPEQLSWNDSQQPSLLGNNIEQLLEQEVIDPSPKISAHFFDIAKNVASFRDTKRWSLLYSVAWRITYENRKLLEFSADEQVHKLLAMQKAVSRDRYKMKAFLRFKRVSHAHGQAEREYFVAWFEPEHLILPLTIPFFIKRFANMHWSILTPDACAHWNQKTVVFSEGCEKPEKIDDEAEELWLSYYEHIFNPARLKIQAMQSEMPKKYWHNLPEAKLIPKLIRNAATDTEKMIESDASQGWAKTEQSQFVKEHQRKLRSRSIQASTRHSRSS